MINPIYFQDENGCTPLHYACIRPESSAIVSMLLDAGANPNMDDGASTPLHKVFLTH
jgi:ankyrin repeat protein